MRITTTAMPIRPTDPDGGQPCVSRQAISRSVKSGVRPAPDRVATGLEAVPLIAYRIPAAGTGRNVSAALPTGRRAVSNSRCSVAAFAVVVGTFPNEYIVIRLICAVFFEQSNDWQIGHGDMVVGALSVIGVAHRERSTSQHINIG